MDYARDPNSIAPCRGYEASDERYEAYRQRFMVGIGQDIDTIILPPEWTGEPPLASREIPERGQE